MNKKDEHYDFMHAHRCITFAIMKLVRFVGVLLLAGQPSLNIWAGNLTPSQSAEPSVKESVRLVPTQPFQNTSTPSSSLEPITKPQELAWDDVKEFQSTKRLSDTPPQDSTVRPQNDSTVRQLSRSTRRQEKLSQFPDNDSIRTQIDHDPAFGIYKDNYFVTGSSFNGGVNKNNSDAKFQISLRYRLIQGVLPYNTYLFISYTQKSFWDIYRKSKPFSESNYNPTIGLGNLICRQGKAVGLALLQYEHESNGRDSIWSRSWNRISLMGQLFFTKNWAMEVKLWIPLSLEDNPDIVRYKGYGLVAGSYISDNDRFRVSACITKRGGWNLNANTELEVAWQACRKINLFLTLQYYNGFGEGMLHYNKYRNMFRIGLAIKPRHISIF